MKQKNAGNNPPNILVIGSFMMDLVVRAPRLPENGETVIGSSLKKFPGGKGANQAVAAARLGGNVTMAGKLGTDGHGDEMLDMIQQEKIQSDHILRDDQSATGVGLVTINAQGENRIIVVPGANLRYQAGELDQIEQVIGKADILLLQLEMELGVVEKAIWLADKHKVPVILNPAPAQELSDSLLHKVTYLTPNKTEAEILTGQSIAEQSDAWLAAQALLDRGVKHVVMTLAEKGALIAHESGIKHVPGFPIQPLDTVAAGDSFNGALAVALTQGATLEDAVVFANAVGALTVTREGAIPSLPFRDEVEGFLAKREEAI